MRIVIIIGLLGLFFISCNQTKHKDENYLDKQAYPIIESFFGAVKAGDESAMSDLLKRNNDISLSDSLTQDLIHKFNLISHASGNFVTDTLLRKKLLNDDIGVYCYLVKYEKKFYRFTFVFYNNGKEVRIFRFSFDERIDIELEESIKLYAN